MVNITYLPQLAEKKSVWCETSESIEQMSTHPPRAYRQASYICTPHKVRCTCWNSMNQPGNCMWWFRCIKDTQWIGVELDEILYKDW